MVLDLPFALNDADSVSHGWLHRTQSQVIVEYNGLLDFTFVLTQGIRYISSVTHIALTVMTGDNLPYKCHLPLVVFAAPCSPGNFADSFGRCTPCSPGCLVCASATSCTACASGLYPNGAGGCADCILGSHCSSCTLPAARVATTLSIGQRRRIHSIASAYQDTCVTSATARPAPGVVHISHHLQTSTVCA